MELNDSTIIGNFEEVTATNETVFIGGDTSIGSLILTRDVRELTVSGDAKIGHIHSGDDADITISGSAIVDHLNVNGKLIVGQHATVQLTALAAVRHLTVSGHATVYAGTLYGYTAVGEHAHLVVEVAEILRANGHAHVCASSIIYGRISQHATLNVREAKLVDAYNNAVIHGTPNVRVNVHDNTVDWRTPMGGVNIPQEVQNTPDSIAYADAATTLWHTFPQENINPEEQTVTGYLSQMHPDVYISDLGRPILYPTREEALMPIINRVMPVTDSDKIAVPVTVKISDLTNYRSLVIINAPIQEVLP